MSSWGETAAETGNGFDLFEVGSGSETPIVSVARDLRHFQAGIHFGGEPIEVVKRIQAGKTAIDEEEAVKREGDGGDGIAEPRAGPPPKPIPPLFQISSS